MVGGITRNIGISIDAVLIVLSALLAQRYAVACEIAVHRRELYLRAGNGKNVAFKYLVALIILLLSLATAFGIFALSMGLWLLRI